jgi:eukaryotic-like serine/threonine-protein kinase
MPDPQRENLKEIFYAAASLSASERAAYLDMVCAGDTSLRQAVESLLKSHDESNNFVHQPDYEVAEMLLDDHNFRPSDMVAHYRILSLLGEGGMGKVYLAEDTKLGRKVSLKFISKNFAGDHEQMRRFAHEARSASALNHPNIITIHEIGHEGARQFIAAEFIEGQTLRERLRSHLELEEILEISIQVASALVAAHRSRIVHRDLKPENIMIRKDDGLVKVLDFGLAKISPNKPRDELIDPEAATMRIANTAPGVVIGTVAYMSPEQSRGESVDDRSDIWSLGVLIYEMVTGSSPFIAASSNEIISAIRSKQPAPSMARLSTNVPERLEEIVEKALDKNRDERYQTSKDLLSDLKRLKKTLELKATAEETSVDVEESKKLSKDVTPRVTNTKVTNTQATSSAEYIVGQLKTHKRGVLVAVGVLLAISTVGLVYQWRAIRINATNQLPIKSIAVLPFINPNSDADTEFLAEGITSNTIERLSQVADLKVISQSAVSRYKSGDNDPRKIGSELGVDAVLTGSMVKHNDDIAINLELVSTKDNSHLWGGHYERKLSDLLAVQREIPADVSDKLRLRLSGESKERLTRVYTENTEAHQLYLKGRYSWEKWTLDGAKQAVGFFEEAIKKDPNYALGYAGLADVYIFGYFAGAGLPRKEAHKRAREAATKALSLDPQLGEAHAALGSVLIFDDWNFVAAEAEFKRGLALNPNFAEGHHEYSHLLLLLGRINESFAECQKFLELDPVSEPPIGHMGYHYLYSRQYDQAIEWFKKDIQLYPDSLQYAQLGEAYYQKGMFREAVDNYLKGFAGLGYPREKIPELQAAFDKSGINGFLRQMLEHNLAEPANAQDHVTIGELYARLGDKDHAFEHLEKAYAEHAALLVRLKEELGYDSLRSDPRYADLMRRIGLPQ